MNERMIPLTDHRGKALVIDDDLTEPLPGSIVLTDGVHGTAWQRYFSPDTKWCSTTGATTTWDRLILKRNLVLVYDAPARAGRPRSKADC